MVSRAPGTRQFQSDSGPLATYQAPPHTRPRLTPDPSQAALRSQLRLRGLILNTQAKNAQRTCLRILALGNTLSQFGVQTSMMAYTTSNEHVITPSGDDVKVSAGNHTHTSIMSSASGASDTSYCPSAYVLAEKRYSHLPESQHAITCRHDQSSHVGSMHSNTDRADATEHPHRHASIIETPYLKDWLHLPWCWPYFLRDCW